ncbi:MAG: S46 family peptidase, partial [Bacteroidetes bacterium]|nr:S46 family peptidase [Bacteroidota bacterium]MBU1580881.1 S46 family peptidase [Bacteroidota bacterium]
QPNKVFYPDANSTMRMTYGSVQEYEAADAIQYNYLTTSAGILEKEDPTDDEFIVPEYLKNLIETRDFGVYGEDGELIICFLTTNDITGGNSGSPVINGKGELIGIAFDGNWEAMSGDIAFEPALQRTINVDIRYVLFVIDKYAGATNLIDELTIRKSAPEPIRTETVDL